MSNDTTQPSNCQAVNEKTNATGAPTHQPLLKSLDNKVTSIESLLNQIICGDCLEVMKQIPSKSVDVILTSPPYNIRNTAGGDVHSLAGGAWKNPALANGYDGYGDCMPHRQYVHWQREVLYECWRLVKDTGAIFYNHKWRQQNGLLQDRADIVEGFPVRQIIIWQRSGGINHTNKHFLPTYEVIYLIPKSKFRLVKGETGVGDVWRIHQESKNKHPAPFPLEIPLQVLRATGAELVLDPFMGSGTTACAAVTLGKNYIGIEQSVEYCQNAEERIRNTRTSETADRR